MAGSDFVAAIMGGLSGGLQGYGQVQQRKRQQQSDADAAAQQEFENQLKLRQLKNAEDDDARADLGASRSFYADMVKRIGPRGDVSPGLAAGMRSVGMGDDIEDELTLPSSIYSGLVGMPGAAGAGTLTAQQRAPEATGRIQVRETQPQRAERIQADQQWSDGQAKKRKFGDLMATVKNPLVKQAAEIGELTGKMPTFSPDVLEDPAVADERNMGAWMRKQNYSHGQDVSRIQLSDRLARERRTTVPKASTDPSERAYQTAFQAAIRDNPDDVDAAVDAGDRAYQADQTMRQKRGGSAPAPMAPGNVAPGQGQSPQQSADALTAKAARTFQQYKQATDPAQKAALRAELQRLHGMRGGAR